MILLTVGTQLPFDRFVEIVDRLAPQVDEEIFAQTGHGRYCPRNMRSQSVVGPIEFEQLVAKSSRIVSHAGIGTIVMAQKHCKPMILFPRLGALDEHRNDHQLATVRALSGRPGIHSAYNEEELTRLIFQPLTNPAPVRELPERERLRDSVGRFIDDQRRLVEGKNGRRI